MEQLIEYHAALESYKNEKFGLVGLVEEILTKNDGNDNMQTEIPENLKRKINSIEHNTEQMITDVQPINSARVEFAKMFASATSSGRYQIKEVYGLLFLIVVSKLFRHSSRPKCSNSSHFTSTKTY